MNEVSLLWHGYRYFPYERELAKREVEVLFGEAPRETRDGLSVAMDGTSPDDIRRLTYVKTAHLPDGTAIMTDQARLERSASEAPGKNGNGGRQSTRYSAHGLHEYRGKYNPQVVRAIGNVLGLGEGSWILDPFCGSGTTLLESANCGWNSVGLELNPLGVMISNAKIEAVMTPLEVLDEEVARSSEELLKRYEGLSFDVVWPESVRCSVAGSAWRSRLPNFAYLTKWFPTDVLVQFSSALSVIEQVRYTSNMQRVVLSDLVRVASYQDPGDLRIRRRKDELSNYPVIESFIGTLREKVQLVSRARRVTSVSGMHRALLADSRDPIAKTCRERGLVDQFDAAITSPPYVTALPYADTQRLSLVLLGLVQASDVMDLDRMLVGTREVPRVEREAAEESIRSDSSVSPDVRQLCSEMLEAVTGSESDGFRRRNVPALVYRYFSDMARVLGRVREALRPEGRFALVVGRNATRLGGRQFVIDTPTLLQSTAVAGGWKPELLLELDTYQRHDLHQRNSIRQESLLIIRRG